MPMIRPSGPRGRFAPRTVDPADKAQLAESPVSWRRVAALFHPHRVQITLVVLLLVGSAIIGLAPPFLTRMIIDDALPQRNIHLLLLAIAAMIAAAAMTSVIGVLQTWMSTRV